MDAHDHSEIDRHVKAALFVFGALLILTGFTVGAYYLHLPTHLAIALPLLLFPTFVALDIVSLD
jgi:hypothetical protein